MAWIKTNESRWNQYIDRAFRRSPSSRRSRQNNVGWWLETTEVKPLTLTSGQKLIKSFEKPRRQRNAFNIHLNAHITRLSSTTAALKSPLLYVAAVISPISARNEGQLKTKVYSIILFVCIFLWVLNVKWESNLVSGEVLGFFFAAGLSVSYIYFEPEAPERSQKARKVGLHLKCRPMNTEGELH